MNDRLDADTAAADAAAREDAARLKERIDGIDADGMALLFSEARTHYGWLDRPVDDAMLVKLYQLVKWAPTSANAQPARYVFIRSEAGRARLKPYLSPGNIEKTITAPATVIVAHDLAFFEDMAKNFPMKDMSGTYRSNPDAAGLMALRNGTIQGTFLILAARALGLDVGVMSGFDHDGVDREFFEGTTLRSNFLCNLGYGDTSKLYRRLPRYTFEEACRIV